jgi:hypothetical protein
MIKFQRESFWDAKGGVTKLMDAHWQEVALHKEERPLDPDWGRYTAAEAGGRLVIVTARREGAMVGYSAFFLYHHPHYRQCYVASNDVIYLDPSCRGQDGLRLIRESEKELIAAGVHCITWHVKPGNDWSPILARMGYGQEEIIMGKMLGDRHGV